MNLFDKKTGKVDARCNFIPTPEVIYIIEKAHPEFQNRVVLSKFDKIEAKLYALISGTLQFASLESKVVPLNIEFIKEINEILFNICDKFYLYNWYNRLKGTPYAFVVDSDNFLDATNEITTKYKSSFNRTLGLCMIILEHLLEMEKRYSKIQRAEKPLDMLNEYFNSSGIVLYDELEDSEAIWEQIKSKLLGV